MAKRHINRLKISDDIVQSCKSFTEHDYYNAFLWAARVAQRVGTNHVLTDDEVRYLQHVIATYSDRHSNQ